MEFNINKGKVLHIVMSHNDRLQYLMNGQQLSAVNKERLSVS